MNKKAIVLAFRKKLIAGGTTKTGAFCQLYQQQVRYSLRLIADSKESACLWDRWDERVATPLISGKSCEYGFLTVCE